MPRRLRLAVLLASLFHGILILGARYHLSYDTYTHMLFADHYRTDWWSLWDSRWYTGFEVISYPPLVHQVISLLSRLMGVDAAYGFVLWLALIAYPLAAYAFSRVFTGRTAAGFAALGAAFLPSVHLSAHTFGQLPTITGTLFALFSAAALAEYLRTGNRLSGALAVMLCAVVMGSHHATLLFLPWVMAAVVLHLLLNRQVSWRTVAPRLAVFSLLAVIAGAIIIWPFWGWGMDQSMQVPIDHQSRHNFFADPEASLVYFWPEYGPLVFVIPFALRKGLQRCFLGPFASFVGLFLLGLGGTTPLPRWLFGPGWEWLTYDRFAFWASLILLPFFGMAVIHLRRRLPSGRRLGASTVAFAFLALVALLVDLYPVVLPTQPRPVEMQPIVDFLSKDGRSSWRYVTFGFGDQFAHLNRLTSATTIDGSYHTARNLPELRTSGIAQIDTAFWQPNGLAALEPVLQKAGTHGVRWGFVNHRAYIPVLRRNGWVKLVTLSNRVQVWENPEAVLPQPFQPPATDPIESFSWGFLPLLALALTASLAGLRVKPYPAQKALLGIHTLAAGLLPVGLVFWYFRPLTALDHPRIYFTYQNAFFFLSDAVALAAVLAWALARWFGPASAVKKDWKAKIQSIYRLFLSSESWLLALCILATLSILWSTHRLAALYTSLHIWLVFALILTLRDRPGTLKAAAIGLSVALGVQVLIGLWQFGAQSTDFLTPLGVEWPGSLDASTPGASVVQLVDGTRWLRVYGTLAHPNILGTFLVVLLAGPALFFLASSAPRAWSALLFGCGLALLVLTFSRAAWIGLAAGGLIVLAKSRRFDRRRLPGLGLVGAMSLVVTALPLRALIFTRLGGTAVATENFSFEARAWLAGQALEIIRQHPVLGVGAGSFTLNLADRAPYGYVVEPVHNLPLLVTSELGIGGAFILAGLAVAITRVVFKVRRPEGIILSVAVIALCFTSLFDHSLWTLAPGRMLLGLGLGLWAGQDARDGD